MKHLIVFIVSLALSAVNVASRELVPNPRTHRQFPYRCGTALPDPDYLWCGCALISNNWVVTAGHCVSTLDSVVVFFGSSLRLDAEMEFIIDKKDFIIHSEFDAISLSNDIALLRTPFVHYTENVRHIRLPAIGKSYPHYEGVKAWVSGWGLGTNMETTNKIELNWIRFDVISNKKCNDFYSILGIPSSMICVNTSDGDSPCEGDSGGPLVSESGNTLLGVQSFVSAGGCYNGYPAVFSRITSHLDWIEHHTRIRY